MTKKDYVSIALVMSVCKKTFEDSLKGVDISKREYALSKGASEAISMAIEGLASTFIKDNPQFSKQKFLKACGIDTNYLFESPEQTIKHIKNEIN